MALKIDKHDILALFNLEDCDVDNVNFVNQGTFTAVHISLRANYPPCNCCGSEKVLIKGYVLKKINYAVLSDRNCILFYHARRYQCTTCNHTFYEENPFCFNQMKISTMTIQNVLRDLKNQSETFSSVARRYHISPTSVSSIFDQHVMMPRLPLTEVICLDECYAFHHQGEKSKYVLTILDYTSNIPIDILPSRKKEYMQSYFMAIPEKERKKVRFLATDMYKPFRYIAKNVFSHSLHCVDRFHVAQELSRKVDAVRIRVMKSVQKYIPNTKQLTDEYYLLKKFNWLIFKRRDAADRDHIPLFDPGRKKLMNNKLQKMLNYHDIRKWIEGIHPDLETAWRLRDDLTDFYEDNTRETASEHIDELIQSFYKSNIPEMIEFAGTLGTWREEILNAFYVVGYSHKVTKDGQVVTSERRPNSSILEQKNSILKIIKHNANGYTSWPRFRNRCLYVLRPEARPLLNPIASEKKKK